jgi:hypothetical protein
VLAQAPDNGVLVKYLFGELAEPEQSRIEELCFTDDGFYEQLAVVENTLIDRYVQNALPEPERNAFEEKYLVTPGRRKRVEETKKIVDLIINYPSDSPKLSRWKYLLGFFERRNLLLQFSLAAMLLVIVTGCVWLIRDRARLAKQVEQTQVSLRQKEIELQQQREAQRQVAGTSPEVSGSTPSENAQEEQLPKVSRDKTQVARVRHQDDKPNASVGSTSVATYVFPLVTVRGVQSQKPLVIRASQRSARLVIYVKNNSYLQFHISIQRVSGEEVWSQTVRKGQSTPTGERISFELSTGVFKKKDYILIVDAVKPDGALENLDTRSFSVVHDELRRD